MSDVYDLVDIYQRLTLDARKVKPEEKKRFVALVNKALRENWAEKAMGGEDVMAPMIGVRDRYRAA